MTDQERAKRLAAALRENLKRRKAQGREAASDERKSKTKANSDES